MRTLALLLLTAIPCATIAADQSPYAGEEVRPIKSLSSKEIRALQKGAGMGFAKLAELNHFPGPKHVLEIADELGLSATQREETQSLYEQVKRDAVALGESLIDAESRLNEEFERGTIREASLETTLLEIGALRARLRYVHLAAHLQQKRLLSPEQVEKYDQLRGYSRQ